MKQIVFIFLSFHLFFNAVATDAAAEYQLVDNTQTIRDIAQLNQSITDLRTERARLIGEEAPPASEIEEDLEQELSSLDASQLESIKNTLTLTKKVLAAELNYYTAYQSQGQLARRSLAGVGISLAAVAMGELFFAPLQVTQAACFINHCTNYSYPNYFAVDGCKQCYTDSGLECVGFFYENMRNRTCGSYYYLKDCATNVTSLVGQMIPSVSAETTHSTTCALIVALVPTLIPPSLLVAGSGALAIINTAAAAYTGYCSRSVTKVWQQAAQMVAANISTIPEGLKANLEFCQSYLIPIEVGSESDLFYREVHTLKNRSWWNYVRARLGIVNPKWRGQQEDSEQLEEEGSEEESELP